MAERGIYEPMFAPKVVLILWATCANQHVAPHSVAHVGFKSGDFHDKSQRENLAIPPLAFMAEKVGFENPCLRQRSHKAFG